MPPKYATELGKVDDERFINLAIKEPFDYTEGHFLLKEYDKFVIQFGNLIECILYKWYNSIK